MMLIEGVSPPKKIIFQEIILQRKFELKTKKKKIKTVLFLNQTVIPTIETTAVS